VTGTVNFNDSAVLTLPLLGSIRTIRDFAEGGNTSPEIQDSLEFRQTDNGGATIQRTWFDNITSTWMTFTPINGAQVVKINDRKLVFGSGAYKFEASFNYQQLNQLSPREMLTPASSGLIQSKPDQTTSLSLLSYTDKLLAGTWRFLTYFGRDSMITMLLMQPILSEGDGGAIEAVISAVLERIRRSDGTVCHEEVIGDYASMINKREGRNLSEPRCDYKMIDTDFYLPIALKNYFLDTQTGKQRAPAFFARTASFLPDNLGELVPHALKHRHLCNLASCFSITPTLLLLGVSTETV
jgi:hypothetical protein